jgi:hypothetical protein
VPPASKKDQCPAETLLRAFGAFGTPRKIDENANKQEFSPAIPEEMPGERIEQMIGETT